MIYVQSQRSAPIQEFYTERQKISVEARVEDKHVVQLMFMLETVTFDQTLF